MFPVLFFSLGVGSIPANHRHLAPLPVILPSATCVRAHRTFFPTKNPASGRAAGLLPFHRNVAANIDTLTVTCAGLYKKVPLTISPSPHYAMPCGLPRGLPRHISAISVDCPPVQLVESTHHTPHLLHLSLQEWKAQPAYYPIPATYKSWYTVL